MALIRLLTFFIIGLFAYMLVRRTLSRPHVRSAPRQEPGAGVPQLVQDPQCGVYVDRAEAIQRKVPGGLLFFCSERCAEAHMHARAGNAAG